MKLHDVGFSSNCKKVRVTAAELELPLELVPVEARVGGVADPGYRAKNPMGKVPTLDDDGFFLFESTAICEYLASKRPERGLAPTDPRGRADLWRWLAWFSAHIQPWLSTVALERFIKPRMAGQPGDEHVAGYAERELKRFVPVLEAHLAGREYVLDRFSIADICLGCGLEVGPNVGFDLTPYPAIRGWLQRLQAREAWKKGAAAR